jgi:hypothetical protein
MGHDRLIRREVSQCPNHGDQAVVATGGFGLGFGALGRESSDGEAVLGVLEGDAFDDAPQLAQRSVRRVAGRLGWMVATGGRAPCDRTMIASDALKYRGRRGRCGAVTFAPNMT